MTPLPVEDQTLGWLREKADQLERVLDSAAATAAGGHWAEAYLDLRVAAEVVATWASVVAAAHGAALGRHVTDGQPPQEAGGASRDGAVTGCGVCGKPLAPGQKQWCGGAHRQAAYRRRHQAQQAPPALAPLRSRRESTVYECPDCETRFVGCQYCVDCHTFARRVGRGGSCPNCLEAVTIADLIEEVGPIE